METKNTSPDEHVNKICSGANCDFAIDSLNEQALCLSGSGGCLAGDLLEADSSGIHDETLIEATQKIRQILSEIPVDSDERKLAFLVTKMGILLDKITD